MTSWCHLYIKLTNCCDPAEGDWLKSEQLISNKCDNKGEKNGWVGWYHKLAEWDDIINNRLTMGRGRWLCYAANAERRQRESEETERRPGVRPLVILEYLILEMDDLGVILYFTFDFIDF